MVMGGPMVCEGATLLGTHGDDRAAISRTKPTSSWLIFSPETEGASALFDDSGYFDLTGDRRRGGRRGDGGIRRGTDVLKAMAYGARAALVGRPILWGLAVGGEDGVSYVLEMLRQEFDLAMALSAVTSPPSPEILSVPCRLGINLPRMLFPFVNLQKTVRSFRAGAF